MEMVLYRVKALKHLHANTSVRLVKQGQLYM